MKNIKWLIAHQPERLFLRTAKAFAKMLAEATKDINIEILTTEQYTEKYDPKFTRDKIFDLVQDNVIQMSQTEVWELGNLTHDENWYVFDMPWLFKSHGHARRVLEGPIGDVMNQRLAKQTNIRGLAYTYSGGYRCVGSKVLIKNLSDLQTKKIRANANPITQDYWKAMGVDVTNQNVHFGSNDPILPEDIHGKDTTYIRYEQADAWLHTEHSLFLTNILVSEKFFSDLSEDMQETFKKIAFEAARLERKWSQEDAENFVAKAREKNTPITELSDDDKQTMKEKSKPVYDKWTKRFMPGLIDGINRLQ
jgi:TRAP-type C4-dicarboxylate transport system substrate-binding protein